MVEDCAELPFDHPHVVRLEARPPNVEGAGAVTLTDLVRQALRMRPDRLVVGEVRGAEVRELLAALNTGHEGGCGTMHANAAADVPARLEALGALAGLDRPAVRGPGRLGARPGGPPAPPPQRASHRRDRQPPWSGRAGLQVVPALVADPSDPAADGERGPAWAALSERLAR